jgi:hypothetical protein
VGEDYGDPPAGQSPASVSLAEADQYITKINGDMQRARKDLAYWRSQGTLPPEKEIFAPWDDFFQEWGGQFAQQSAASSRAIDYEDYVPDWYKQIAEQKPRQIAHDYYVRARQYRDALWARYHPASWQPRPDPPPPPDPATDPPIVPPVFGPGGAVSGAASAVAGAALPLLVVGAVAVGAVVVLSRR